MRTSSVARVFLAGLGVSVVITLGCTSPGGPSGLFSVVSISPIEGSSAGGTRVVIEGTGFLIRGEAASTVMVDGSRVNASPDIDGKTISLTMPAHAAGKVEVTVIAPSGQAQASVPGGYTYVPIPPPVVSEVIPNIGSTAGGTPIAIYGANGIGAFESVATVTVDGVPAKILDNGWPTYDYLYLSMPAHAAGTVEVILTDRSGQSGSGTFTYASPDTFDFNGDWEGNALASSQWPAILALTIRDNIVVSLSCSVCRRATCELVPSPTLDPPPVVTDGAFSFAGSDGGSIDGKILSPNFLSGSINMASCVRSGQWTARKK